MTSDVQDQLYQKLLSSPYLKSETKLELTIPFLPKLKTSACFFLSFYKQKVIMIILLNLTERRFIFMQSGVFLCKRGDPGLESNIQPF